jgi:hypothetical protein
MYEFIPERSLLKDIIALRFDPKENIYMIRTIVAIIVGK